MAAGTRASPPTGFSLSRPPRPRGGAPGQAAARQRPRSAPSACRSPGPGLAPRQPRSSRASPPPGSSPRSSGAGWGGEAASRPLRGSGGRALPGGAAPASDPQHGSGRAPGGNQPEERRGRGCALPGWPLLHCLLRFCRPLRCVSMLKPGLCLEEAEEGLEREALTPQPFSQPLVLLPAGGSAFACLIQRSSLSPEPAS